MTRARHADSIGGESHNAEDAASALGVAGWLSLAPAPSFAIMALLTSVGGGPADVLCSAAPAGSSLSGMVPMYLLMAGFNLAPWLKLVAKPTKRHSPISTRRPKS